MKGWFSFWGPRQAQPVQDPGGNDRGAERHLPGRSLTEQPAFRAVHSGLVQQPFGKTAQGTWRQSHNPA